MSEVTNAGTMTVLKVAQLARKVCLKYFFVCFFFLNYTCNCRESWSKKKNAKIRLIFKIKHRLHHLATTLVLTLNSSSPSLLCRNLPVVLLSQSTTSLNFPDSSSHSSSSTSRSKVKAFIYPPPAPRPLGTDQCIMYLTRMRVCVWFFFYISAPFRN